MFDAPHFRFIRDAVGIERLIRSVDHPYLSLDGTRSFIEEGPVSEDERHRIAHGNAEALFRL